VFEEFGAAPAVFTAIRFVRAWRSDQINKNKKFWLTRKFLTAAHPTPQGIGELEQGGWIDERLGLQVSGIFRRLKYCAAQPLVQSRKFPLSFEPSAGAQEVRSLIESVQQQSQRGAVGTFTRPGSTYTKISHCPFALDSKGNRTAISTWPVADRRRLPVKPVRSAVHGRREDSTAPDG